MALRVSDHDETNTYYAAQAAVGYEVAQSLKPLWLEYDPLDLPGTLLRISQPAAAVGNVFAPASIALAADYYAALREAMAVTGAFRVPVIDGPTMAQFEAQLAAETEQLMSAVDAVVDELFLAELTIQLDAQVAGTVEGMVLDAGSSEVFAAVNADPQARGWARITRPGACSFCRLLASRGAVYRSQETANFRAHTPTNGRGGVCRCGAEPVFGAYEATARARADDAIWQEVTQDGFRGSSAVNEFRRRVEGRADGARRITSGTPAAPAKTQQQKRGFANLTPTQLQHQLEVLAQLPDSDYRAAQTQRVQARLRELGGS